MVFVVLKNLLTIGELIGMVLGSNFHGEHIKDIIKKHED